MLKKLLTRKKTNTNKVILPDCKEFFLSLGAGRNQIGLIHAARELGYRVIAVDKNAEAPGFALADLQMYCSLLQPKKILQNIQNTVAIDGNLVGVGCRSFGRANLSAALLADRLALPGPQLNNLGVFQNKIQLKKLFKKLEIPTANSYTMTYQSFAKKEMKSYIKYLPLLVRPAVGHAKQGVCLLESQESLQNFLQQQRANNISNLLFDQYLEGREVTVLGFVVQGKFQLVCISEKNVAKSPPRFVELQHTYPCDISIKLVQKICKYMQHICDETQLNSTPIVAEFLVCDFDDKMPLAIIECSPESGGEYLADQLVPAAFGHSYFEDLVRVYTAGELEKSETSYVKSIYGQPQGQVVIRFIAQQNGRIKKLQFPSQLMEHEGLLFAHYLKKPGDKTSVNNGNFDRLAVFGIKEPLESKTIHQQVGQIVTKMQVEYYEE